MSMPAERMSSRPNLAELFDGIVAAPPVALGGVREDSRQLARGDLFLACQGATRHGLEFATDALQAGVAAIAWDETTGDAKLLAQVDAADVPIVAVPNLAGRIGEIANRWFAAPSHALDVVGVTGTNGKSTVAWLAAGALTSSGTMAGYLGTLGASVTGLSVAGGLTTPSCLDVHATLADFRDSGAAAAAIEVSSHGLVQQRVQGVQFDAALFTNLSRDHIDYHGCMDAYFAAKATLFTEFACRRRIVCIDDEWGQRLAAQLGPEVIVTARGAERSKHAERFVNAVRIKATERGSVVDVQSSWGDGELQLPLVGEFNVANALQVLALLLDRGLPFSDAVTQLSALDAPPGRLQRVDGYPGGPAVYVDYAHTPAALEAVLQALRPHSDGRIWCVFGCGGDRDKGKRPLMGRVVSRLADRAVITNDNPRSEAPGAIIADIQEAMTSDAFVIEDRGEAIAWTIAEADAGDTVVIAGKGHEDYQLIGDARLNFSDYEVARASLGQRGSGVSA